MLPPRNRWRSLRDRTAGGEALPERRRPAGTGGDRHGGRAANAGACHARQWHPIEQRPDPASGRRAGGKWFAGRGGHGATGAAQLAPEPALPKPKRRVDLSTAQLPGIGGLQAVETLTIRERKGVGATFTPNVAATLMFHGLVYKPQGEFDGLYQIIAGPLLHDPRIANRATRIAFVPALDWSAVEVVLVPIKLSKHGQRVLSDLQKLEPRFPAYKAFIQWVETKRRHVVYFDELSEPEGAIIAKVKWPTQEQMLDALSAVAFETIEDLAAANEDVRALLKSRQVD